MIQEEKGKWEGKRGEQRIQRQEEWRVHPEADRKPQNHWFWLGASEGKQQYS